LADILTPVSLWKDFDDSLDVMPVTLGEKIENGIKYEYVTFSGRDTGMGRVTIYGVFAASQSNPSKNVVLILPDSNRTVDEKTLNFFIENGYSAFMVDYRGKVEGLERYTVYPDNVAYANVAKCGSHKDYVEESADKTSWYEWVAVGIYARKYLSEKLDTANIGLLGIRDGGEIAWKLATVAKFSCAVTVCAGGWKVYSGYSKFGGEEPFLDDERYRYLAGVDSQSYAPYVKCPIIMLCPTNDYSFDYDRAYDTFSRINPQFAENSVIAYSVKTSACIGGKGARDMFMFLDRFVKQRQVFIPNPAEITITVDEDDNLVAKAQFDSNGIVESFGLYMAEDCKNSSIRDWLEAPYKRKISDTEHEFFLNIYEKTSMLFALCYVTYSNGFTVWSKIAVKKISGKFRNSQPKCKVLYSSKYGNDCFTIADIDNYTIGGAFFMNSNLLPKLVVKEKGLKGIYSACGLSTYRLNSVKYEHDKDSILKLDVCPDANCMLELTIVVVESGEKYTAKIYTLGRVWQSVFLENKIFKNGAGAYLTDYSKELILTINCKEPYALNNLMWL
jgi:hypothetical protein